MTTIDVLLAPGRRLLLDTTTLVAYLDGREQVSPIAAHIVDNLVESGRNDAVVSMISAMELLVRPTRQGLKLPYHHAMDFLSRFPHLTTLPIDLPIAQEAASLRATFRLRSPDALIVATGIIAQVSYLVTNDADWQSKLRPIADRVKVCYLRDYV